MTKIKKALSLVIVFSIVLSVFTFPVVSQAQTPDLKSENAYDLLTKLNIDVVNENKKITRSEFATIILRTVKQFDNNLDIGESYFKDVQGVPSSYINAAVDLGYFKKSPNGMFRPDDYITFEEAVVVCVRVLGYEYAVGDSYSFAKYYNIANSKDLLDGVDAENFDAISINVLLFNMLNAPCADTIYAENKIELPQSSLIETIYGVAHYVGTVEALNGVSVVKSNNTDTNKIVIDGVAYNSDEKYDTADFLGNTADYYLTRENGSVKLFAMYKYDEGNTLLLTGDDIAEVSSDLSEIEYYSGNSTKTAKLSAGVSVVYNNTKKFNVSPKDFMSENARVLLTDGDENGRYDTALISNPEYYKISAVDTKDMFVGSANEKANLELGELASEDLLEIVTANGNSATLDDIKKGTYVEVLLSKNSVGAIDYTKNIKIIILSETISGTVEAIEYDGGAVTVNGKEYRYASETADELTLGTSAVFYLGTNGKIIGISDIMPDINTYGYLVGVKKSSSLSETVQAKIFSQSGEMKIYDTDSRVTYTGYIGTEYVESKNIDAAKLTDYITEGQLVKFYVDNNGLLKKLACAYDYTHDNAYEGNDDSKFTLEYHNTRGEFYNVVASENHYYDTNSLVFSIPEDGSDRDYSVGPYTMYPELSNVDIKLYDSSASFVCKVGVMITSSTLAADFTDEELGDQNIALISKRYKKIEGEDEVIAFKAYTKGKEVTLVAKREDLQDASVTVPSQGEKETIYFNELNPGDIIQYKADGNNKVILINVLHRYNKNDTSSKYYTLNPDQNHLSLMITQTGLIEKYKPDGYFTVTNSNGKKHNFSDKRIPYYIYIYDIKDGDVEVVNPLTYLNEKDSMNPDYVFVKSRRTSLRDLVVYRNR